MIFRSRSSAPGVFVTCDTALKAFHQPDGYQFRLLKNRFLSVRFGVVFKKWCQHVCNCTDVVTRQERERVRKDARRTLGEIGHIESTDMRAHLDQEARG